MEKISPYRYPLITSFLTPNCGLDLWDELAQSKRSKRTYLDPLIERIGPTVLNRVLPLLSLSINEQPVYTWGRLKQIQKVNHMPLQVDPEDEDPWDVIGRPVELTMLLKIAFSQRPKAADWNTLKSLCDGLEGPERADLNTLFIELYEVSLANLFDTTDSLWAEPEKIQDVPQTRDILGQQFVPISQTKWKRIDRVVNEHKVYLVECYNDYDEEDRTSRECTRHVQVGCAATLEGAIEVSAKILDQIKVQYAPDEHGRLGHDGPDYRAIQICRSGDTLLTAKLKQAPISSLSATNTLDYEAQWVHPFSPAEVDQMKVQIDEIYKEARMESGWDNHSTAQGLRKQAAKLESRLPSEKHDSYAVQETLRKTMAKIGDQRQSAALLGVDLGL